MLFFWIIYSKNPEFIYIIYLLTHITIALLQFFDFASQIENV